MYVGFGCSCLCVVLFSLVRAPPINRRRGGAEEGRSSRMYFVGTSESFPELRLLTSSRNASLDNPGCIGPT